MRALRTPEWSWLLVFVGLGGVVSDARGQPPPSFPSGVELITVDVVVADGKGRPVAGLTRDDFVLKEDGAVQQIVGFEAFELEAGARGDRTPSAVASNEIDRSPGAAFVLLRDDAAMLPSDAVSARAAVASLLERSVAAGDEVTVATSSGEAWWTARLPEGRADLMAVVSRIRGRNAALSRSIDAMSDYEAHWIAERGDAGLSASILKDATGEGREVGVGSVSERVLARRREAGLCSGGCWAAIRASAIRLDPAPAGGPRPAPAGSSRARTAARH